MHLPPWTQVIDLDNARKWLEGGNSSHARLHAEPFRSTGSASEKVLPRLNAVRCFSLRRSFHVEKNDFVRADLHRPRLPAHVNGSALKIVLGLGNPSNGLRHGHIPKLRGEKLILIHT